MDTRVQIPQSRGNRALESMQVARRVADSTSGEPGRVPITSTAQSAVFLSVDASHGLPITEISASRTSPPAASKTPQRNATAAAATSKAPLPAISSPPSAQQQSVSKQQSPHQTPSRVPSLSTPSRVPSLSPSSLDIRPASSSQFLRPQDRQLVSIAAETTGSSQERYSRQLSLKRQPSTGTPDTGTGTRPSTAAQQSKSSVTSGSAAVSTLASSPAIRGRVDAGAAASSYDRTRVAEVSSARNLHPQKPVAHANVPVDLVALTAAASSRRQADADASAVQRAASGASSRAARSKTPVSAIERP